jgi:phosphatidylserine/phosphatidylglycerophosphate/cardiolipin synthase-like enzyme
MKNKKDLIYLIVIVILLGITGQAYYSHRIKPQQERQVKVYYNQDKELNKEIIKLTQDADKFVYFAVYTFTREDIKNAILAAKYRGLTVIGISDKNQYKALESQRKVINDLREAGIPVYEQDHLAIMHLKVLVTDKAYASGSFNWTSAATNLNDEVLEVGQDNSIRSQYQKVLEGLFKKYESN